MQWLSWACSLVVLYAIGLRWWVILLGWIPASMLVISIWAYAGKYLLPPKLQRSTSDPRQSRVAILWSRLPSFVVIWLVLALSMAAECGAMMWAASSFRPSPYEDYGFFVLFSMPSRWINASLNVTVNTSFRTACFIILLNAFFYNAIVFFPLFKGVHWWLRRNRVTQLTIDPIHVNGDDD